MNDDLNLLISFASKDYSLVKVAIRIEHGMNDMKWRDNWQYWGDPEVEQMYRDVMPMHVESFCHKILHVEELFDIKGA